MPTSRATLSSAPMHRVVRQSQQHGGLLAVFSSYVFCPSHARTYVLTLLQRQVFYIDANGRIMSSNTTGANPWPPPYNILPDDSAMQGTKALAVCADTNADSGLNGLRVYFGNSRLQAVLRTYTDLCSIIRA